LKAFSNKQKVPARLGLVTNVNLITVKWFSN